MGAKMPFQGHAIIMVVVFPIQEAKSQGQDQNRGLEPGDVQADNTFVRNHSGKRGVTGSFGETISICKKTVLDQQDNGC